MGESFLTVFGEGIGEYTEKRSRFIGAAQPVLCEEDATEFIAKIKSKHRDARHNVFAFTLKDGIKRYSDDGEPSGTGGAPILEILERRELYNCAVVVTRYFGGILLGTGGLVRSYSAAATNALEAAGTAKMVQRFRGEISCGYDLYNRLLSSLGKFGILIENSDFSDSVFLQISLPPEGRKPLTEMLRDASGGRCVPRFTDAFFAKEKL